MINIDTTLNYWSECECPPHIESVSSLTSLKISAESIQENRFVVKLSQNNWWLSTTQFRWSFPASSI